MSDGKNPKHPGWDVGAEVFLDARGVETVKIAKVYKTGNVVLEGDPFQQYRPRGDTAYYAGGRYGGLGVRLATDEECARRAELHEISRARSRAVTLADTLASTRDARPYLAEIEALIAKLGAGRDG